MAKNKPIGDNSRKGAVRKEHKHTILKLIDM